MLTLNEAQWQALQQGEARQFVAAVCDEFLTNRPEMLQQPGREVVLVRMQDAHDYAARAGFTSTPHIVRLMYLSADAPRIHDDPLVDHYLRKPGATPEQRLDDLDAVMKHKLKGDR
ncbi:hypothetical protein LM497_30040 [Pseudomonas aeruginosa]|uniref:hypothetical protein n=1 Tax=Pseudomonas aeruginosa TaxID=287 RepID=UPI0021474524|nr:hypothetical protein [Pseudomonas aeruginosa]MCQ9730184.1 hypothetical protein [Pseudomonas aeruginosa]